MAIPVSADILSVSKEQIQLSGANVDERILIGINTFTPENFSITINNPDQNQVRFEDSFYLRPAVPGASGTVKVVMDFPYHDRTTSGLENKNSANRVINGMSKSASDAFTYCQTRQNQDRSVSICKPLYIRVVDDQTAIPGLLYTAVLNILVEDSEGKGRPESKVITLNYRRRGAAIGIKLNDRDLYLNQGNDFSTGTSLCVFSPVYKDFELTLESNQHQGDQFYLLNRQLQKKLPYNASVSLNKGKSQLAAHSTWLEGGRLINARNAGECGVEHNADILLNIDPQTILNSQPGVYNGVLTVRVKGL